VDDDGDGNDDDYDNDNDDDYDGDYSVDDRIAFIICYNHDMIHNVLGLCTTDIIVQSLTGIYDRSGNNGVNNNNHHHRDDIDGNKDDKDGVSAGINKINNYIINPFRKYTIVNVLYCSGDVHGGNVTRSYRDKV
jgi:hypothetical protein